MQLPANAFKRSLAERRRQIGLWLGLADSYVAELLATTGFDWLVIDAEHAPNDMRSVLRQLQAIAPYPVAPVVRLPSDDTVLIKQYLDIGAQTLLVPMVESAQQASSIVRAARYPPAGARGVGSALARASRWAQVDRYLHVASQELCVLVQIESVSGLENLAAIAAVDGIDGIFFGPSDLAASFGKLGGSSDPEIQQRIGEGIELVCRAGKAAGVLSDDPAVATKYFARGASFIAVGIDTTLLVGSARTRAALFKSDTST